MKKWLLGLIALLLPMNVLHSLDCSDNTVRIMSYNIRNARGMDNVIDYQRTADVINRVSPSVVTLQEVDSVTGRSSGTDVMRELAERTLMYRVYAPAINFDGGKYGVGILSKEKPLRTYYVPLPGREEERVLLIVELDKYILACTHLSLTEEDRMASLAIIEKEAQKANKAFILTGDLNAKPESPFIKELQKSFELLNNPKNPTFPAPNPRECIDYIAVYKGTGNVVTPLNSFVENEPVASDHRPVVVDVRLKADE